MESRPDAPLQPPRHELIEFDGDGLVAVVLEGDGVAVPVRIMCESIGLDTETQVGQLRAHPVLSAGLRMVNVAMGGRIRSVVALIHHRIPFWLATISPNLVNEATRPKLVRYQEELADILARLFYGEAASPPALSVNPEIAALQRQFDAAVLDMRRIREALIAEQQRLSATVQDTQQQLTSLSEIVTELETVIPIVPAQAEYIQRTIKRLAKRLSQQRARIPATNRQRRTCINSSLASLRLICVFRVMMRCRVGTMTAHSAGCKRRPERCCRMTLKRCRRIRSSYFDHGESA